ncbi:MAG: hypothetical protein GVY33_02665 [Alphaproteobacteria bacterium]|jgi:hypothetical protein|nr:hypothetical protein [Alphaproteobacteria bacterium]
MLRMARNGAPWRISPAAARCDFAPVFATAPEAAELLDGEPPEVEAEPL